MHFLFNFSDDRFEKSTLLDLCINTLNKKETVIWIDCRDFKYSFNDSKYTYKLKKLFKMDNLDKILLDLLKEYPNNFTYTKVPRPKIRWKSKYIKNYFSEIAINNELITRTRDSDPNIIIKYLSQNSLKKLYTEIDYSIYHGYKNIIKKIDTVYFFNGRFLREKSAIFAIKKISENIKILYVERFSPQWNVRYCIFKANVHSVIERTQLINDFYKRGPSNKNKLGKKWFEERIIGISQPYTKNQSEFFNKPTHNAGFDVFFHSSEDELIISNLRSNSWKNQFELVTKLTKYYQVKGKLLYIRLHPNLKNKSLRERLKWKYFSYMLTNESVKFIPPRSKINSYDLIKNSENILTFGSTIGVEAAYLKKRSFLLSNAFHEKLGITISVNSFAKFKRLISKKPSKLLINKSYRNSLKYGYFMEEGGITITNLDKNESDVRQDPIFGLKGKTLGENYLVNILKFLELKITKFFLSLLDLISILIFKKSLNEEGRVNLR